MRDFNLILLAKRFCPAGILALGSDLSECFHYLQTIKLHSYVITCSFGQIPLWISDWVPFSAGFRFIMDGLLNGAGNSRSACAVNLLAKAAWRASDLWTKQSTYKQWVNLHINLLAVKKFWLQGLKQVPSGSPGQVHSLAGQVTFNPWNPMIKI